MVNKQIRDEDDTDNEMVQKWHKNKIKLKCNDNTKNLFIYNYYTVTVGLIIVTQENVDQIITLQWNRESSAYVDNWNKQAVAGAPIWGGG